ncbi:MAG: DUF4240 domain-containing protein, partial [Eubacteriales bacterium]|nr:DUF4240 domain-containing protein [Eubacteriales bacterium]
DMADTGGVFAASCFFNDYMSDDGFNDFRMWLISRGRDTYMAALKNPDTLADLEMPEDIQSTMDTRWEGYGYVAPIMLISRPDAQMMFTTLWSSVR